MDHESKASADCSPEVTDLCSDVFGYIWKFSQFRDICAASATCRLFMKECRAGLAFVKEVSINASNLLTVTNHCANLESILEVSMHVSKHALIRVMKRNKRLKFVDLGRFGGSYQSPAEFLELLSFCSDDTKFSVFHEVYLSEENLHWFEILAAHSHRITTFQTNSMYPYFNSKITFSHLTALGLRIPSLNLSELERFPNLTELEISCHTIADRDWTGAVRKLQGVRKLSLIFFGQTGGAVSLLEAFPDIQHLTLARMCSRRFHQDDALKKIAGPEAIDELFRRNALFSKLQILCLKGDCSQDGFISTVNNLRKIAPNLTALFIGSLREDLLSNSRFLFKMEGFGCDIDIGRW